jgi:hypothetical protein
MSLNDTVRLLKVPEPVCGSSRLTNAPFHDLGESLKTNVFASQDLVQRVMAHSRIAFQLSNSSLENVLFDVFACNYLFRLLIFERREFNETQVLALFPPTVGLFPHVST